MDNQAIDVDHLKRESVFAIRACAVGLIAAYSIVLSLKWAGMMPDHLTWLRLSVVPAMPLIIIGSKFAGYLWQGRWRWLFIPVTWTFIAIMIGLMWWERGLIAQ